MKENETFVLRAVLIKPGTLIFLNRTRLQVPIKPSKDMKSNDCLARGKSYEEILWKVMPESAELNAKLHFTFDEKKALQSLLVKVSCHKMVHRESKPFQQCKLPTNKRSLVFCTQIYFYQNTVKRRYSAKKHPKFTNVVQFSLKFYPENVSCSITFLHP